MTNSFNKLSLLLLLAGPVVVDAGDKPPAIPDVRTGGMGGSHKKETSHVLDSAVTINFSRKTRHRHFPIITNEPEIASA